MKLFTIILCSILFIEQNFFNLLLSQSNPRLVCINNINEIVI